MQVPVEIAFRNMQSSDELKRLIEKEVAKLERACDHIGSCRVAVERQSKPQRTGNPFRVRIEVRVPPRHDVVATHEPPDSPMHDPLPIVLKRAFASARGQLRKLVEKQRGQVKSHPEQEAMAVVYKLIPNEGYGFLKTPEGEDIYFHRNAVLHGDFDRLEIGTGVRYARESGESGPQASTVQLVDKPGVRASGDESEATPPLGWNDDGKRKG